MMRPLNIRPSAIADVNASAAYIANDSVENALRLYDAVDATYGLIERNPLAWPRLSIVQHPQLQELRHRPVVGFPSYMVVYRVDAEAIVVLHILHAARDLPAVLARELGPEPE